MKRSRDFTPEQGASSYAYNNDDTVQTVTDARGATTNFTYNARQLVRTITYGVPGGVAATPNVATDYDGAGNRLWMTDGLGRVDYVYDQLSQLTSEKRSFSDSLPNAPLPNNAYQLNYTYDRAGQLMSVTNPFGSQFSYARSNQSGEISSVSGSGSNSASSYVGSLSYRAFGAAKQIGYGNGRQLSLSYDNRLRLTQWNIPGVMGWNYAYNYFNENNGRVTYAQNVNDSTLDRSYQYDHVGRLVSAHTGIEARAHIGIGPWNGMDGPYSQDRGYDQFGNATHRVGWGGYQGGGFDQSYSFTNNRLVQDPGTGATLQYDASGNLTNDGQQSFTYDATGQQASASGSGLTQSYDGDGLRAKKAGNGATKYYLRSTVLGGQVIAETDGGGTWTRGYVYLGGQMIAVQAGGVNWVCQDPVTKSQRVTDNLGNVISTVDLDPWGGETSRSSNQAFQPHRYTTYERDSNGGDEAMMRRYHSYWNRFSQPDPYDGSYNLTDPQSFNRYSYTQNDPVNFVDPTGLDGLPSIGFYGLPPWAFPPAENVGDPGGGGEMGLLQQRPVGGDPQQTLLHELGHTQGAERPHCGVNPITARPGFTNDPRGVPGNLRPGIGGGGQFHAPRRGNPIGHQGLDVSAIPGQSPIYANRAGTVTFIGLTRGLAGNLVIIDHGGGVTTRYAHLSSFADFAIGDDVNEGEEIGVAGQTGNASRLPVSEAHVHFGVQVNGQNVNPATYLNSPCP